MDPRRFVPRLDPLETRETPATGLTPEIVHRAEFLANTFYDGNTAALTDQSFIRRASNRPAVLETSAIETWQAPILQEILTRYVIGLNEEKAAADPVYGEWFDGLISRYTATAVRAHDAGVMAQQVTALINQFNQADAQAAARAQAGGTGTTGTGTTGLNSFPFGTNVPTTGTNTNTTTPPATTSTNVTPPPTSTTSGTGTTTPGAGSTTGSSPTGTTPTQSSGLSPGTATF